MRLGGIEFCHWLLVHMTTSLSEIVMNTERKETVNVKERGSWTGVALCSATWSTPNKKETPRLETLKESCQNANENVSTWPRVFFHRVTSDSNAHSRRFSFQWFDGLLFFFLLPFSFHLLCENRLFVILCLVLSKLSSYFPHQLFEPKKTISYFSKSWRLATVFV